MNARKRHVLICLCSLYEAVKMHALARRTCRPLQRTVRLDLVKEEASGAMCEQPPMTPCRLSHDVEPGKQQALEADAEMMLSLQKAKRRHIGQVLSPLRIPWVLNFHDALLRYRFWPPCTQRPSRLQQRQLCGQHISSGDVRRVRHRMRC